MQFKGKRLIATQGVTREKEQGNNSVEKSVYI